MYTREVIIKSVIDDEGVTMTSISFDTTDLKMKLLLENDTPASAAAVLGQIAEGLANMCAALQAAPSFRTPEALLETLKPMVRKTFDRVFQSEIVEDEPGSEPNKN